MCLSFLQIAEYFRIRCQRSSKSLGKFIVAYITETKEREREREKDYL